MRSRFVKIFDDLIRIPIDSCITHDFELVFHPQFINILKKKETIVFKDKKGSVVAYIENLVTTTEPTLEHEGGYYSFQFKKINDKWRFTKLCTIP